MIEMSRFVRVDVSMRHFGVLAHGLHHCWYSAFDQLKMGVLFDLHILALARWHKYSTSRFRKHTAKKIS